MDKNNFFDVYSDVKDDVQKVKRKYPMKVSRYYLNLIKEVGDPIWKQCIPDIKELQDHTNEEDPLLEEKFTPVPCVVHRYPDRVLLLASNKCAMYCRFCTRKRKVGREVPITRETIQNAINYIKEHKEVRDVIISGGDPLMIKDSEIEFILKGLREIDHVEIIRIGTRVPCTLPSRITKRLCNMMRKYQPIYFNVHFEHPREITEESRRACGLLADAGFPLNNQTVLLKGVNDNPETMKELCHKLLSMRVRPYYLYQADCVKGTEHFRVPIEKGMEIIKSLHGHTSGMAVPHFIIDTEGGGKIPVLPKYVKFENNGRLVMENFEKKIIEYKDPVSERDEESLLDFRVAIVFNLKKTPEKGEPVDYYAEFDEIDVPIAIKDALKKVTNSVDLLEADDLLYNKLQKGKYDFVFNIAEGLHGDSRESHVPAMLEMLKIPYSGSGVCTQAITLDKRRKKEILSHHNIPTPRFQVMTSLRQKLESELRFPLFVKPNSEGSSKGIRNNSIANNAEELKDIVRYVTKNYSQPALVEEYLPGREFTVSIMGNTNPHVLPIVEILFDHLPEELNKIDSYDVKWYWDNPTVAEKTVRCPAQIDAKLERAIKDVALKTYKVLGCADFSRMDIRLDSDGAPHVIDVNALPGLMPNPSENSRFPKACYAAGMTYDNIIHTIFFSALERYGLLNSKKVNGSLQKVGKFGGQILKEVFK